MTIPRRTPIRKRRLTLRRGEPTPAEKAAIRERVRDDAGGKCELRLHELCCGDRELPLEGSIYDRGHLVHPKSRRVHPWKQKGMRWGCYWCHLIVLHTYGKDGKKPCPPKPRD